MSFRPSLGRGLLLRLVSGGGLLISIAVMVVVVGGGFWFITNSLAKKEVPEVPGSPGNGGDAPGSNPDVRGSVSGSLESRAKNIVEGARDKANSISEDLSKVMSLPPNPLHQLFYLLSHHERSANDPDRYVAEVRLKIEEIVKDRQAKGSVAPDLNAIDSSVMIDSSGQQVSVSYPRSTYINGDSSSSGGITGCKGQSIVVAILDEPEGMRERILKLILSYKGSGLLNLDAPCPDANPNLDGFQTYTPLMYAASKGDRASVQLLLDAGATRETRVLGFTAEDVASGDCKSLVRLK